MKVRCRRQTKDAHPQLGTASALIGTVFFKTFPKCLGDLIRNKDEAGAGGCGYLSCLQCGLRRYDGELIQKKMVGGQPMPGGRKLQQEILH